MCVTNIYENLVSNFACAGIVLSDKGRPLVASCGSRHAKLIRSVNPERRLDACSLKQKLLLSENLHTVACGERISSSCSAVCFFHNRGKWASLKVRGHCRNAWFDVISTIWRRTRYFVAISLNSTFVENITFGGIFSILAACTTTQEQMELYFSHMRSSSSKFDEILAFSTNILNDSIFSILANRLKSIKLFCLIGAHPRSFIGFGSIEGLEYNHFVVTDSCVHLPFHILIPQ